jgi:hypothetical protein
MAELVVTDQGIGMDRRTFTHLAALSCVIAPYSLLFTLVGCATLRTFTNYDSSKLSDEHVAILENKGCLFCVKQISRVDDGTLVYDANKDGAASPIKLTSGTYSVQISEQWPKISMVTRQGTAELKAGHVYRVRQESCYIPGYVLGLCHVGHSYTGTLWIEDVATGNVLVGEKWE